MAGRLKRPIAPQIITDAEGGDSNYVSHGGSLHLAKGIAVTKRGMQHTAAGDKFLSLSREDLEPLGSLGKGSSGSVKRVRHRATGQVFAVKEIKLGSDRHLAEIEKEISTLYNGENGEEELSSPHIIDFFGAYASDGSVFIALEAMDGSLMDVVQPSKGVPEKILAAVARAVLQGLLYLHKQRHLVHRDIKPQNLLYRQDGAVKITDFGVCSQLENTRAGTSSFVGTVTYMSPERLEGTNYSFSADIWSLGVTLVQLASGEHPYEKIVGTNRETEAKFWSLVQHLKEASAPVPTGDFSPEFGDFVKICLLKDKDGRPGASELLAHPWITKHTQGDPADRDCIRVWLEERARELAAAPKAAPAISQEDLLSALAAMEDIKR